MSFTYNLNIPNGPNNPSADQPLMKTNTNSINSWTGVDHVDFSGIGGVGAGQHLQVTFFDENPPGVAPTDPSSILYTNVGTASSVAELYYQNQNLIMPISLIKAYVVFNSGVGTPTILNSYNVSTVTFGGGFYNVNIPANILANTNYGVLYDVSAVIPSTNNSPGYNPVSVNQIVFTNIPNNTRVTVLVVQI